MPDEIDQSTSGRSLSVFIVEDEFLIALDLGQMLEENGHSIVGPASSVAAALRLLDSEKPDVAILDVNLRGELVTPVAEQLQRLTIPFLLCTAYPLEDLNGSPILRDAERLGKPVNGQRLFEILDRLVG